MWCAMRGRGVPVVLALLLALLGVPACKQAEPPLMIGYVGGLTGRVAGLGVAGRDAVLLAVEERNAAGGINGRRVELISRDDQQDEETARKAARALIDTGVVAIVGPMTSAMATVMLPLTNPARVVLISPTVTTNQFNELDDHFFRVTMPLRVNAAKLAQYAVSRGLKKFAVCIDTANAAYTEDWFVSFRAPFEAAGGRVVHVERYKSGAEGGVFPLAERIVKSRPDAVLLLCGAMDSALIAQQVRKLGSPFPLFGTEWAFTSDIVNFGGGAVEEMQSFVTYNPTSQVSRHQQFLASFEKRFGYRPSFAAVLSYEAASYLFAGLERNPRREGLKDALLAVGSFPGLQGEIRINRFGDPNRETYLAVIRQGRFATID